MDDKKKLEKALAVARDFYNGSDHAISHIEFKMALEAIFPELGQPESEMIRTSLLEMVEWVRKQQSHTKGFNEVEWDKFKEWLESQKRLNPVVHGVSKERIDPDLNDYCCEVFSRLEKENGGVLSFARLQHLAMDIEEWVRGSILNKQVMSEESDVEVCLKEETVTNPNPHEPDENNITVSLNLSKRLRELFKDEILSEIDVEKMKKEYRDNLPFVGEYAQYGDALAHSFGEGLDAMVKLFVNRLIKPTK